MKNTLLAVLLVASAVIQLLTLRELKDTRENVVADTITAFTTADRIDSYNAGYRSGAMNILAEMVECEGVEDKTVLAFYSTTADTLRNMGELDINPYPCSE